MDELTLVDAVNRALADAMSEDDSVLVLGEDVGVNGGVFRATDGLQQTYGPQRVIDTPLAETGIAGLAVGLAAQGFKPVIEIQFMGFIYSTLDQIISHAARLRLRTRGRLHCPMVMRAPYGGGIHAPEHHSESLEALFAHIPGIKLVMPSHPSQAYHLLRQAIEDPDPVVFLEPKRIYRAVTETVDSDHRSPTLGQAVVRKPGHDLTLVSWGAMMKETLLAAEQLGESGINAEVIDIATLKPLDSAAIIQSVKKTGRLLVVHEAPQTAGFGAEIISRVADGAFFKLLAPLRRVAGYDTVMPLPKLEQFYMPGVERIVATAQELVKYR